MAKITLELKIEEIDTILTALGNQPFVQVAEVISKIRNQAVPQYEQMQGAQVADTGVNTQE